MADRISGLAFVATFTERCIHMKQAISFRFTIRCQRCERLEISTRHGLPFRKFRFRIVLYHSTLKFDGNTYPDLAILIPRPGNNSSRPRNEDDRQSADLQNQSSGKELILTNQE